MEINQLMQADLSSLQQALGMATLKKAMNQDAAAVSSLLQGMQVASAKTMELSVNPHIGSQIDLRL